MEEGAAEEAVEEVALCAYDVAVLEILESIVSRVAEESLVKVIESPIGEFDGEDEDEEVARDEPIVIPPPEVPKKLGWDIMLSVRLGKGDIAKRGSCTVQMFETVFITRHAKGNSVYVPFGVNRSAVEFAAFCDAFRLLNRTGGVIKSPFPPGCLVPEQQDLNLPAAEQLLRLQQLQVWLTDLLAVFSTLPKMQKLGACITVYEFFDIHENTRNNNATLTELKEILRLKIFDGDFSPPSQLGEGENARFAKTSKPSHKPPRHFDYWSKQRAHADHFEHRYDHQKKGFYLFNPYSGETIVDPSGAGAHGILDRGVSLWKPPDAFPDRAPRETSSQQLLPCLFASRAGVAARRFKGWKSNRAGAALILTSAARGLLARTRLQTMLSTSFSKVLDKESQCYYFVDARTNRSSWTKPRLAGVFTIPEQPPDLRNDVKTVQSSYCDGPVFRRRGGKGVFERLKPFSGRELREPERPATEREPAMLDMEETPFRVLMLWVEANVDKFELYAPLKEMLLTDDWVTLLLVMQKRTEDVFCQIYCCYAFSRMRLGPEGGMFADAKTALEHLMTCLVDWHARLRYGCNQLLFCATALLRILQNHAARLEFFSTKHINDKPSISMSGDAEAFIEEKIYIFCRILRQIPVEIFHEQVEKGFMRNMTEVAKPTLRGVEMVELVLQIIGALLHERETREIVGEKAAIYVIHALRVCNAEAFVLQYGLRCLYNTMYMCRLGWQALVWRTDLMKLLAEISDGPMGGDPEVHLDLRRVELASEEEGWAGHVERRIEAEMAERREGFIEAFKSKNNSPADSPVSLLSSSQTLSPSTSPEKGKELAKTKSTLSQGSPSGRSVKFSVDDNYDAGDNNDDLPLSGSGGINGSSSAGQLWDARPNTVLTPGTLQNQSGKPK